VRLYLAGPLFTSAERDFLEQFAARLTAAGHECFVPHTKTFDTLDAPTVFAVDSAGLRGAQVMVAWLDGPSIDDGTACEIGIFSELVAREPDTYRGIIGLAMDWRLERRRSAGMTEGGLNFFVAGAVLAYGRIVWTIDDVIATLHDWEPS
jgi:nucleoside 2-deoxyribosyltransferase